MIFGCVMILAGVIPAAANWYSPFSRAITGKYSSMVPPVGGLLIGIGIYSLTDSIWWALLCIPSDLGLLLLPVFLPRMIAEVFVHSKFNRVGDYQAFRSGHKTTLTLYKNSTARFTCSTGDSQYGFSGKWSEIDDGYEICDYLDSRHCILTRNGHNLESTETSCVDAELNEIDLNGLTFTLVNSDG